VVWVEWVGNGEEWVRELYEKGADAVYIPPGSEALQWLMNNPSGFELLAHDRNHGAILEIPD
jgi:glucan biosynthesis protein